MNNLEKYLDQVIEQKPVVYEPPAEPPLTPPPPPEEPPTVNLLAIVRRRWYLVLLVALVLSALAVPVIWLVLEPQYTVAGTVQVLSAAPNPLEPNPTAGLGSSTEALGTQAFYLTRNPLILRRVADQLGGQGLSFFSGKPQTRLGALLARIVPLSGTPDPEKILRDAIARKRIVANVDPRTEIIALSLRTTHVDEGKTIVDSFLSNYKYQTETVADSAGSKKRQVLEDARNKLEASTKEERDTIRKLSLPVGTASPAPVEQMELSLQAKLASELINLELQRTAAAADVNLAAATKPTDLSPTEKIRQMREYVNSDPMVSEWSKSIVAMERELETQKALVKDNYPRLTQQQAALDNLKKKLDTKRQELEKEFEERSKAREEELAQQRLETAKKQQEALDARYEALKGKVKQQDVKRREAGQANIEIEDVQFRLKADEEQLNHVYRQLRMLDFEQPQGQAARVTIYPSEVAEVSDRRPQLTVAAILGAVACGVGLALLRDRADKTLQTPADVTRQLDLPVVGTTTSSRAVKPALLADQIAGDYQTIRTNLGLLYDGGLPRRLVVSSAGTREGKTTFAVNLATSLAKAGKKVLLIDGDLRKPDVGQMLNVPPDTGYLQDVLLGGDSASLVYVSPTSGLHVLPANPRHMADPYELLTSSMTAEQIERLAREYDHIIIDSPPALAFPDALVWAKLAEAVVLVSFAGQTTGPELKEAKDRFARGRARVLGAVLSNVPAEESLYRYAYTYRSRGAQPGRKARRLLLASQAQKPGGNGSEA